MTTYNPYKLFCGSFVPNWLMERTEISAGAKLCFARLAQFAGADGQCFPKLETLANALGVKKRMVQYYIRELEKFNLIKAISQGPRCPRRYVFLENPWIVRAQSGVQDTAPLGVQDIAPPYKENQGKKKIYKKKIENQGVLTDKEEQKLKKDATEVLQYLNEKTDGAFKTNDCTLAHITYRLQENVSVQACKRVIDMKTKEWKNTLMEKYLRPSTLFKKINFENYYGKCVPSELVVSRNNSRNNSRNPFTYKVFTKFYLDKHFPLHNNLSDSHREYNKLQRAGINAMVKEGIAIIQ